MSILTSFLLNPHWVSLHRVDENRSKLIVSTLDFLALPLPCVENSRYFTFEELQPFVTVGFIKVQIKWKKSGKWLIGCTEETREAVSHLMSFARKACVDKVIEIILQSYYHDYSTLSQRL
ncbi:hypothetical protein M405DRAFT_560651 [Rhizopogon salebrosus TDB-379]|nr:hypothetical protein M405DRAFT_560651 [Rhizopogon salebrosus TDB-379]